MWIAVLSNQPGSVVEIPNYIETTEDAEQYLYDHGYISPSVMSATLYEVASRHSINLATIFETCSKRQQEAISAKQQEEADAMRRKLLEKYGS